MSGRADDAALLEAAAAAIERWARAGRSPWDRCVCGHHRSYHWGRGIGCVGGGSGVCLDDCQRFRVNIEDKIGCTNRTLIDQLRRAAHDMRTE